MGFNFNHFFGYEDLINKNPDLVLIYGFAGIVFGMTGLVLLTLIFRKLGLIAIIDHFLGPLLCALGLTLLLAIFPTILFKVLANDLTGVKLVYIWITMLLGMLVFSFLNYRMIGKRITSGT
jgi:hypothetical protein